MASALAAQLKQQLEGHQELMWQQEQQQLEQLQALMQQLPMPGGDALGSPNSAQHMQLLLQQEINNNMQQAALAAAAAEAANQRLNALRYAMHAPGLLAAAAGGDYGAATAAPPASAGFCNSTGPVVHGNGLFNGPAVCEPLTLGLDWNRHHHQQQQQQQRLPTHFPPGNSNTLQGLMGPSAGSPALHPLAAAASAYGHSSSHVSNAPAGLGFAGNDVSNNEQALLAMLLSQMQGSAAPGMGSPLHSMGAACGVGNAHFQGPNSGAAQAQAAASALLAAAAAAQMAPGAAAGGVMPGYTDGLMAAPLAVQPQGGLHGFFMQ
jgi:hypothetical protein